MRRGLIISVALHVAILIWAIVVWPSADDARPPSLAVVPVDLMTTGEVTKIKAGNKDAKSDETRAAKRQEKQSGSEQKLPDSKARIVRAPAPAKAPEPDAEPAPVPRPMKKAEPEPAPKPKEKPRQVANVAPPAPARKPKPAARPKPLHQQAAELDKKRDFNPDDIAALLNKAPNAQARKLAAPAPAPEPPVPARGRAQGEDATMSLSEIDALRARISQCWNPPVGGLGADAIKVRLRLQLARDGMLQSQPQVVNREASPFFQAAADSAVRAVMLCQPYALPAAKYAMWRDMILNFDPREMFGG